MGKRKLRIAKIENKAFRTITFTKRRQGLFKKAGELCVLCNAEIAILTFSPAGKPFAFSHPSIESIISRCGFNLPTPIATPKAAFFSHDPLLHVYSCSSVDPTRYWWELVNVDDFADERNLHHLKNALEELREGVYARLGFNFMRSNESTLRSVSGGVPSSPLSGSNVVELCGSVPEFVHGNFGGQSSGFLVSESLPGVTN